MLFGIEQLDRINMPKNVFDILSYGVIGLGFLLALLAYRLLTQEQRITKPRANILKAIYTFMAFSIVLCILGFIGEFRKVGSSLKENNTLGTPRERGGNTPIVLDVSNLVPRVKEILRRERERGNLENYVRILAADAGELFTHIKSVIYSEEFIGAEFEFALVDPDFDRIDDVNPTVNEKVQISLKRIDELRNDSSLQKKRVVVKPPRLYRYYPNVWGVMVNESDLLIGFHDWVPDNDEEKQWLEGTQYGILYIKDDDPVWDRFSSLFKSWFYHSEVKTTFSNVNK